MGAVVDKRQVRGHKRRLVIPSCAAGLVVLSACGPNDGRADTDPQHIGAPAEPSSVVFSGMKNYFSVRNNQAQHIRDRLLANGIDEYAELAECEGVTTFRVYYETEGEKDKLMNALGSPTEAIQDSSDERSVEMVRCP